MGQFALENDTPFAFEALMLADENGRALLVPIVKATYVMLPAGALKIADEQLPVNVSGELWGEPSQSSYKYEPECAFVKLATDVVLIAQAHAPGGHATEVYVRFCVGPLEKTIRVSGDRYWIRTFGTTGVTSPE